MIRCLKQVTYCVIERDDGRRYEATNLCQVDGATECPRVAAGCETGTGYELCGSTHAEANCARLAADSADVPGRATLYGHDWMCRDCQHALVAVGVTTFTISPAPVPPFDPDWRVHPRETLLEALADRGLDHGWSRAYLDLVEGIVHRGVAIGENEAHDLQTLTGISAPFWLALQHHYDRPLTVRPSALCSPEQGGADGSAPGP